MSHDVGFQFGDNSFDYFRMYSAIMIILGHCVTHLNLNPPLAFNSIRGLWVGLFCLFCLTGYLVPASLERSISSKEFIKKRFLRLYPGLYAALALSFVCVMLVGQAFGLHYRLKDIGLWLIAQLTVFQFYTPSSLEQYGVDNPNGALWTISMEIQIYFMIMMCWGWLKKQNDKVWFILITIGIVLNLSFDSIESYLPSMVYKLINITYIPYAYPFLIGMYCYQRREKIIPILTKGFWPLLLSYIAWIVINSHYLGLMIGHYTNIITGIYVCLLTLSGGYNFGKHRIKWEVSYGLYIYHMIVINVFVMFGLDEKNYLMLTVLAVTWFIALLSYKFVEKPCVALGKK